MQTTNRKEVLELLQRQMNDLLRDAATDNADLWSAMAQRASMQSDAREMKEHLANIEHHMLVNTEFNGRNAEIRAAQLQEALRNDEAYVSLKTRLGNKELEIGRLDAQIEYLRNKVSLGKLAARWNIAVAEAFAADETVG